MQKSSDILKAVEQIIIDTTQSCLKINKALQPYLKDAPKGIYLVNDSTPKIKNDQTYYTRKDFNQQIPLTSLDNINDDVLDSNGVLVLPRFILQNKNKLLTTEPLINPATIKIVEVLIGIHICDLIKFTDITSIDNSFNIIHSCLNEEGQELLEKDGGLFIGKLSNLISLELTKISNFINEDVTNIYLLKPIGFTTFCIEKCGDYRIYDWLIHKEEGYEWTLKEKPTYDDALSANKAILEQLEQPKKSKRGNKSRPEMFPG